MNRDRLIQLLSLLTALGLLGGSGAVAVNLSASAGRHRLVYTDTAVKGQPPQVALGIAMGAFRGVFVNYLWIRANQLKEDGRYHEAVDLSRAITTLQPRFPHVWVFHAWNLAYNISVQTLTNRERWRWVNAGIDLLRTEGVPNNPNDLLVHRELAWIFLHKIGAFMDDANLYYKRSLAAEWSLVLGPPPAPDPRDRDRRAVTKKYADWLRQVADAPDTLEATIAAEPAVATLVDLLRERTGFDPDWKVVRNYTVMDAIIRSAERPAFESGFDDRRRAFVALMEDPALAKAWPALVHHLRKRVLVDVYNMDPQRMVRYTETFGPLDWRHPAAHGLYWSQTGLENALTRWTEQNKSNFDFVNGGRIVVQSLQDLWRSGDMHFDLLAYIRDPEDEQVFLRRVNNPHFIETYGEQLDRYIRLSWADNYRKRAYTIYAQGYENFMKDAIRFLYRRGELQRAQNLKDALAVWPYHNVNDPDRPYIMSLPLDKFVEHELQDQLSRPTVAIEETIGALHSAFVNGLIAGDSDLFRKDFQYAAAVHAFYFSQQTARTQLDPAQGRMAQMDRRFPVVAGAEFAAFASTLDLDAAEALYDNAPIDLRRWAYDILVSRFKPYFDQLAQQPVTQDGKPRRTFAQVFPEPENMTDHRAMMERMRREFQEAKPDLEKK